MPTEKQRLDKLVKTTEKLLGGDKTVVAARERIRIREQRELAQASSTTSGETEPDGDT